MRETCESSCQPIWDCNPSDLRRAISYVTVERLLLLRLWESGNPEGISKLAKRASFPQPFRRPLCVWLDSSFSWAFGLSRRFAKR